MKQILDQVLQFLQQGIAAIFRVIHIIWTWSIDQITKIFQVPWDAWPIWKQILLVLVIAGVLFFLFRAAVELWWAGIRVLRAFATLLVAFVMTLPAMLAAGLIALAGLWALNNVNFASWPTVTTLWPAPAPAPSPAPPPDTTVGRSNNSTDTTGAAR